MHTMDSNGSNVPAFITKLWKLVEDPNYDHLIQWNQQNGRSFIIHDQSKFSKDLLPLYFKHSNMASFIRQLNMYGFRKVSNIENSGLRSERDDIEFFNQYFAKGREYELEFIKRKVSLKSSTQISTGKSGVPSPHLKHEDMSDILQDMESIKGKQDSVDNLLTTMQRENEALWREVAILRQKHHKQQQIVEKLIQFLVSLVQNRGLMGIKRKAQLMIDDTEENRQKLRNKIMKPNDYTQNFSPGNSRSNGPIIHDITDDDIEEEILNAESPITAQNISELSPNPQVFSPENICVNPNSPNDQVIKEDNILDPLRESIKELGFDAESADEPLANCSSSSNEASDVEQLFRSSLNTPPGSPSLLKENTFESLKPNSDQTTNDVKDLVISKPNNNQHITTSSLNNHVEGIEAELDWLQDQLSSGINIDSATLLGLFSLDDTNNPLNNFQMNLNQPSNEILGNEVVQFNPTNNTLFDDLDLDQIATEETRDPLLEEELLPNLDAVSEGSVSFPLDSGVENGQSLKCEPFN